MSKKLAFLGLSLLFFNTNTESPSEKKDKYEEWCEKLNLKEEQLRKMSRFLGDVKRGLLAEEKLASYRESFKSDSGYKVGPNENVISALDAFQTIAHDPVLLKAAIQIGVLAALDVSYGLSNETIQKLDKNYTFSESEEREILLSIKNSFKRCRAYVKSKLQDKK